VWEKAGVGVSVVYGTMPPEAYRAARGAAAVKSPSGNGVRGRRARAPWALAELLRAPGPRCTALAGLRYCQRLRAQRGSSGGASWGDLAHPAPLSRMHSGVEAKLRRRLEARTQPQAGCLGSAGLRIRGPGRRRSGPRARAAGRRRRRALLRGGHQFGHAPAQPVRADDALQLPLL